MTLRAFVSRVSLRKPSEDERMGRIKARRIHTPASKQSICHVMNAKVNPPKIDNAWLSATKGRRSSTPDV